MACHALRGDLGVSLATTGAAQGLTATPVASLIGQGLGVTLALTGIGTLLAALLGVLRAEFDHFLAATSAGGPYLVPVEAALGGLLVNDAIRAAVASGGAAEVTR